MYDARTNLGNEVKDDVIKYFREKYIKQLFLETYRLSEAPSYGQAIVDCDPRFVRCWKRTWS